MRGGVHARRRRPYAPADETVQKLKASPLVGGALMTWKRGITLELLSAKCETIIFDHDISWVNGGHLGFNLAVTLAHHRFW